jgi:hypothetical protein
VESAIGRGLYERSNRNNPWAVISALFTGMFDDHTNEWLNKRRISEVTSAAKARQSSPPSMRSSDDSGEVHQFSTLGAPMFTHVERM